MNRTGPWIRWRAVIGVMLAASLAFGGAGCGSKRARVYPVRGQVFWEGKPAVGAVVYFHPFTDEPPTNEKPAVGTKSVGRVKDDGSFSLSTFGTNDGAPAGRYRVSLLWLERKAGSNEEVDLLPPEYSNAYTCPLEIVEIRAEKNVLPPFQLPK